MIKLHSISLNLIAPSAMVLFGGCANDGSVLGDLWILELNCTGSYNVRAHWKRVQTRMTPNFWHTSAVVNGHLFGKKVLVN
ncbi:unnamed protein product [Enterobius vermicularis]|uniref:Secreted protein n=1 Tax=Enterobius vermicularis TaxID=51028 RepID=A0A0N4V0M5_ENTVE|nr:unnamed protein product [Enterobius vermicularis]